MICLYLTLSISQYLSLFSCFIINVSRCLLQGFMLETLKYGELLINLFGLVYQCAKYFNPLWVYIK